MLIYPGLRWLRSSKIQQLLNSAAFFAPNTHSLNLTLGTGSQTITRATTHTVQNNDGYMVTCLAGEIPIKGGRRVDNLIRLGAAQSATLAVAANVTMTLPAGQYVFSMGVGTGRATFSGTGGATGTLDASASGRVSVSKTITAGTLVVTASVATLVDLQVESVDAQTTKTAGEYVSVGVLSSPWHGAGVDGVKWLSSDINGNPIAAATLDGAEVWPAATNVWTAPTDLSNGAWTQNAVTVSTNTAAAPNGATEMDSVLETTANALHRLSQTTGLVDSTGAVTIKAYVRKLGRQYVYLECNSFGLGVYQVFDLDAVAVASNGNWAGGSGGFAKTGATIEQIQTGLFEITFSLTSSYLGGTLFGSVGSSSGNNFTAFVGDVTKGVIAWGLQFTTGAYASPFVSGTRNASVISVPTASNIASASGFIALEYTPQHAPSGTVYLWGTYVDANNSTAILHDATNLIFRKRIAGVNYDATIANAFVSGTTYNMAASHGASGLNIALGGTLGTPNTTGITGSPYIKLPGSGYVSAPDSADQRPTGNVTFIAKVGAADYTPTSANVIYIDGDNVSDAWHSLYVYIDTTGVVVVSRPTASGTARSYTSTAGLSSVVSDNADVYLKCAWEQNVGGVSRCTFSYSTDGVSYTQLGNVVTHADVTAARNINGGGPRIGQAPSYGGFPFNGRIYSVKLLDATNTAVIDCNPADYTSGGTTWTSSTTGEVYTVNGTASMWPFVRIAATMQTGADGNSASQPGMAIKNVYVGNRALSNAELQAISLR